MRTVKAAAVVAIVPLLMVGALQILRADPFVASDPGVRGGPADAGDNLAGLTASQQAFFNQSRIQFEEADGAEEGLGPRFNLDSCVGCHSQPASGGAGPSAEPPAGPAAALRAP